MLKCNLSVLLSERNLKITKVSNDTGISRTTLTALSNNTGRGLQFDTMNTLCTYLDISPSQLFLFAPYDITVQLEFIDDKWDNLINSLDDSGLNNDLSFSIEFNILSKRKVITAGMCGLATIYKNQYKLIDSVDIYVDFYEIDEDDIDEEFVREKLHLIKYLGELHISLLKDIEDKICEEIADKCEYENEVVLNSYKSEDDFILEYGIYVEDLLDINYALNWPVEITIKRELK